MLVQSHPWISAWMGKSLGLMMGSQKVRLPEIGIQVYPTFAQMAMSEKNNQMVCMAVCKYQWIFLLGRIDGNIHLNQCIPCI